MKIRKARKKMAGSTTDHFMPAISRHWRIVSGFAHAVLKARFDEKLVLCRRSRFLNIVKETGKNRFPLKRSVPLTTKRSKYPQRVSLKIFVLTHDRRIGVEVEFKNRGLNRSSSGFGQTLHLHRAMPCRRVLPKLLHAQVRLQAHAASFRRMLSGSANHGWNS